MKIEQADHRASVAQRIALYIIDPVTQERTTLFASYEPSYVIPPSVTVGIEVNIEPIETEREARDSRAPTEAQERR